jgi:hypothetical protein
MDEFVPITPVNFFQFKFDCQFIEGSFSKLSSKKISKYILPSLSELCHEYCFGELAIGWNYEGIHVLLNVSQPFRRTCYPDITRGDSLELFLDTRDVKTSGYATKFCHHFFFLPEPVEEVHAGELTRFRSEDMHELCQSSALHVNSQKKKEGYSLQVLIPSNCLFGYDPEQFDRLGFAYRINRAEGSPQHFCVTSEDYSLEQNPSLWCSMRLIK